MASLGSERQEVGSGNAATPEGKACGWRDLVFCFSRILVVDVDVDV